MTIHGAEKHHRSNTCSQLLDIRLPHSTTALSKAIASPKKRSFTNCKDDFSNKKYMSSKFHKNIQLLSDI